MGSISKRQRAGGDFGYTAQIVIRSKGIKVYTEARTFDREPAARAWMKRREAEIARDGFSKSTGTLADAIDKYTSESLKEIGKTKAQVLSAIRKMGIAGLDCAEIRSHDIVNFATALSKKVQPQTVGNYMSHLAAVFAIAKPAWGFALDPAEMDAAVKVCKRLGLLARSRARDRRPTRDEMNRLMAHFEDRSRRRNSLPMHKVALFAMFSTRRQDEIIRIRWDDLEPGRVLVRDMKNPDEKSGNNVWCDLPPEAEALIATMPKRAAEIFPYTTDAVSAAFTRACKFLEIEDLHFHDLRHEGVSRLFEMGFTIPHAAAVSGHRSWSSLQRYTHVRGRGDVWADWEWKAKLIPPPVSD